MKTGYQGEEKTEWRNRKERAHMEKKETWWRKEGIDFVFDFVPGEEDREQAWEDLVEEGEKMKGGREQVKRVEVKLEKGRDEGEWFAYTVHKKQFDRIRRITGYLVGTTDRFNPGKQAEEKDRVPHSKIP